MNVESNYFAAAVLAPEGPALDALRREGSDAHYVIASKCFTVFWGLVAISFASETFLTR